MGETGIIGLKSRFDQFVAIEIHECDFAMHNLIVEAAFAYEQIRVAMMAWSFALLDDDFTMIVAAARKDASSMATCGSVDDPSVVVVKQ